MDHPPASAGTSPTAAPAPDTVSVALSDRSYDILIGDGLLNEAGKILAPHLSRPRAIVVTDRTVAAHYRDRFEAALRSAGIAVDTIVLPPGEETKSFSVLADLCGQCLELGVERSDTLIALGGGVIGDLTGFAAAILLRGMNFVQVPTTLLAQVDSSVGGKTAIDVPAGKNLVGAFHQPRLVLIDPATLDTLDRRQRLAGYAETVKYGLLGDRDFFEWLETNASTIVGDAPGDNGAARRRAIKIACETKAAIVARDEKESGERALLNLGHTFAHALETATGYGDRLLHGEAVAIGMCMAFGVSAEMGWSTGQDTGRVTSHLRGVGLPTSPADIPGLSVSTDGMMTLMMKDKKVSGGKINFIMVRGIGEAFVTADVDTAVLKSYLNTALRGTGA